MTHFPLIWLIFIWHVQGPCVRTAPAIVEAERRVDLIRGEENRRRTGAYLFERQASVQVNDFEGPDSSGAFLNMLL